MGSTTYLKGLHVSREQFARVQRVLRRRRHWGGLAAVAMAVTTAAAWKTPERSGPTRPAISSLRSIQTPKPPDLARYVREEPVLVVLGKALFWDAQLSSDNKVACASCHFHAGADHRPQNQLSAVNGHVPPNQLLSSVHLPFSRQEMEAGWRVASAGVLPRRLTAVGERGAVDQGIDLHGAQYANVHGANVRQVTKRNAPSVINAVYSVRQFWDGRAATLEDQATGPMSSAAEMNSPPERQLMRRLDADAYYHVAFRGVFGFPVTPFQKDLSLDLAALERNCDWMAGFPFCSQVIAGGTGEVYSMTPEESIECVRVSVKAINGRMPVVALSFNERVVHQES